jgi:hypothetical protein
VKIIGIKNGLYRTLLGADLGLAYSLLFPQSILGYVSISGTGIQNDRDWKATYNQKKVVIDDLKPDIEFEPNKIVHRSIIYFWRTFIKQPRAEGWAAKESNFYILLKCRLN